MSATARAQSGPRGPLAALRAALRARTARWMRQRQGTDRLPVTLAGNRLYILPSGPGLAFAGLLLLMLLAGLNYGNSLAIFLTFLFGAFALVAMQLCHRNLLGLELASADAPAVFAGGSGTLTLILASGGRKPRLRIAASLPQNAAVLVDVAPRLPVRLELVVPAPRRGVVRLDRLQLATVHPFGLFRAWTWVHAPIEMLVYPHPGGSLPLPVLGGGRSGAHAQHTAGADEWLGLRPFRDGDSPRQVAWKAYAREAPLLVKEYTQATAELCELEYARLAHLGPEERLSQLARWVIDAETHGERYGLTLPGVRLPPGRGTEHRHRCLAALARFGVGD